MVQRSSTYGLLAAVLLGAVTVGLLSWNIDVPLLLPSRYMNRPITLPHLTQSEDRHLSTSECFKRYPDLYVEADRAEEWYRKRGGISEGMVDSAEKDGSNARLTIIDNVLYVKSYNGDYGSRTKAAIGSVYAALLTSPEPLPDLDFVLQVSDAGSGEWPHFVLDRKADQEALWLMPDFGFFSWPEPGVGSYVDVRRKTSAYEKKLGLSFNTSDTSEMVSNSWEEKTKKLFWRGVPMVDVRRDLLEACANQPWSDVQDLNWGAVNQDDAGREANHGDLKSPAEHCQYAFLAHTEGWAYSGRLKYLQQCRSIIVTHPLQYIQHFHHLLNGDDGHPDQNVVEVPLPFTKNLAGTMEDILSESSKDKVQRILDNSWKFLRQGYISPAANDCYFRYALRSYANSQKFRPSIDDTAVSYESFVLMGATTWDVHR